MPLVGVEDQEDLRVDYTLMVVHLLVRSYNHLRLVVEVIQDIFRASGVLVIEDICAARSAVPQDDLGLIVHVDLWYLA